MATRIPVQEQRLTCGGVELDSLTTLRSANIRQEATVCISLRLLGGMEGPQGQADASLAFAGSRPTLQLGPREGGPHRHEQPWGGLEAAMRNLAEATREKPPSRAKTATCCCCKCGFVQARLTLFKPMCICPRQLPTPAWAKPLQTLTRAIVAKTAK